MNTYYNLTPAQMEKLRSEAGRFNEAWTADEKNVVCELFRDGKRVDEIARMQGRTTNAIRIKLVQAGEIAPYLSRQKQPWTEEETDRLGRFYSQGYGLAACAKLLGRVRREVEDKLIEIGLLTASTRARERDPNFPNAYEPWTNEEIAQLRTEMEGFQPILISLSEIAARHGRSIGSIVSRAAALGLTSLREAI